MRATQTATSQMTCVKDVRKHRKIRALLSAILDAEWVLPSLDEAVVIEAIDGLTSALGRQPTLKELADTVGAPEHSVRSMLHSLVQKGYLEASRFDDSAWQGLDSAGVADVDAPRIVRDDDEVLLRREGADVGETGVARSR